MRHEDGSLVVQRRRCAEDASKIVPKIYVEDTVMKRCVMKVKRYCRDASKIRGLFFDFVPMTDSQHSRSSQSSRSRGSQHSRSSQQPRGSPGAGGGPRVEKILSRVTSPVAAEERRAFLPADRRPGPEMGPYGRDRATPDPFYYGPPRWRQRAWVTEGEEDGQQDGVQLRRDKNF